MKNINKIAKENRNNERSVKAHRGFISRIVEALERTLCAYNGQYGEEIHY